MSYSEDEFSTSFPWEDNLSDAEKTWPNTVQPAQASVNWLKPEVVNRSQTGYKYTRANIWQTLTVTYTYAALTDEQFQEFWAVMNSARLTYGKLLLDITPLHKMNISERSCTVDTTANSGARSVQLTDLTADQSTISSMGDFISIDDTLYVVNADFGSVSTTGTVTVNRPLRKTATAGDVVKLDPVRMTARISEAETVYGRTTDGYYYLEVTFVEDYF